MPRWRRTLAAVAIGLALLTAIGLVAFWPTGAAPHLGHGLGPTQAASVIVTRGVPCTGDPSARCRQATVRVAHQRVTIALGEIANAPSLSTAESIRVSGASTPGSGRHAAATTIWQFVDVDRHGALLWLSAVAVLSAALPLLLISRYSAEGALNAVNSQDLAEPIVATLVGCIALVCAVPLTTRLAAMLMSQLNPSDAQMSAHHHHH